MGEKYADATMKLNIVELEGFEDGDDYDAAVDAVRAYEHCSGNEGGSGDGGAHAGHNH